MMTLKQEDGYLYPYLENNGFDKPSQDLPPIFEVNGSIYVISPEELEKERTFIPRQAIPLVIKSSKESLDIDTKSDVDLANYYAKN
jgi:CMP-N-acetylneuraminic acid synthetase